MFAKELLIIMIIVIIILTTIVHKLLNKKNKLLSFWIAFSIFTIIYVSYMLINKNHVVKYNCNTKYWNKKDYKLDGLFFLDTYGEYKCGADLRYNNQSSIVYYNELINILISSALIFSVNTPKIFTKLLIAQALNTIVYFVKLDNLSKIKLFPTKKIIYLSITSLYVIIPLILAFKK